MTATRTWAPYELRPSDLGVPASAEGLATYLSDHADTLAAHLTQAKALVFRGFGVTEAELGPVSDILLPEKLSYVHGNSPRTKVGAQIYTSTEYPPEFTISMHNELSYSTTWPSRLLFFCAEAAETGGATAVTDAAVWLHSLDEEVRAAYAGGVRYTQNLHGGFGLGKSWQETFETTEREQVEEFLAAAGCDWKWRRDGSLWVSHVRPSTTTHPVTGDEVWVNQSDQWHPAALGEEGTTLAALLPPEELPQSVSFADGTPIPAEYVFQVRDRGLDAAVDVDWRHGDLLLIDNVLVAHGRRPFTGRRRVLVSMSR